MYWLCYCYLMAIALGSFGDPALAAPANLSANADFNFQNAHFNARQMWLTINLRILNQAILNPASSPTCDGGINKTVCFSGENLTLLYDRITFLEPLPCKYAFMTFEIKMPNVTNQIRGELDSDTDYYCYDIDFGIDQSQSLTSSFWIHNLPSDSWNFRGYTPTSDGLNASSICYHYMAVDDVSPFFETCTFGSSFTPQLKVRTICMFNVTNQAGNGTMSLAITVSNPDALYRGEIYVAKPPVLNVCPVMVAGDQVAQFGNTGTNYVTSYTIADGATETFFLAIYPWVATGEISVNWNLQPMA